MKKAALGTLALLLVLSGPRIVSQGAKPEECSCRNVRASSLPSVPTDICTRNETGGSCSLVWNSGTPARASITGPTSLMRFNQAFGDAVTGGQTVSAPRPPRLNAVCDGNPDRGCLWVEYMRRPSYEDNPESAAVGFVGLASAAWTAAGDAIKAKAVLVEIQQPDQRRQLGLALSSRNLLTRARDSYTLRAVLGCLQIRANGGPPATATVEIQNQVSRNENSCPQ